MRRFTCFVILSFVLVACAASQAANLPRVAVLDVSSRTLGANNCATLSERLRSELARTGRFAIVERQDMEAILKEQGYQQNPCMDTECIVQIGRLIGAEKIAAGSIDLFEGVYTINIRLIELETGVVERTALEDCECALREVLTQALAKVSAELAGVENRGQVSRVAETSRILPAAPSVQVATSLVARGNGFVSVGLSQTLTGHSSGILSTSVSSDGNLAITGSVDKSVRVWRISDGSLIRTLSGHSDWVSSTALTIDGQYAASGSFDGTVRVWRVSDGSLVRSYMGHSGWVRSVSINANGQFVASSGNDNTIRIWQVGSGALVDTIRETDGEIHGIAISSDGNKIASACDAMVKIRSLPGGNVTRSIPVNANGAHVRCFAYSADERVIVVGADNNQIYVIRVSDGTVIRTLSVNTGSVVSLAISSDGGIVASGSSGGNTTIWQLSDGAILQNLPGHVGSVLGVALSADLRTVVTAGEDQTARIWRAQR